MLDWKYSIGMTPKSTIFVCLLVNLCSSVGFKKTYGRINHGKFQKFCERNLYDDHTGLLGGPFKTWQLHNVIVNREPINAIEIIAICGS